MKKWLLLVGLAAVTAYAAKKIFSEQADNSFCGAVKDVILDLDDEEFQAPVETAEPTPDDIAPSSTSVEDMSEQAPIDKDY